MQDINFTWPQGEDLYIDLRYKEGPNTKSSVAVDLRNGYSAKMGIAAPGSTTPIFTASTDGGQIVLLSGNNEPNIRIRLDRSITLTGGFGAAGGSFAYDLFLRNGNGDQIKVIEGTIHIKKSVTQWA